MKILLSGAQGTGKSTLNLELMKHFPSFTSLDSVSAKFAKSKEDFKDEQKLKSFQTKISLYCYFLYLDTDNCISSRSLADAYAYNKFEYSKTLDTRYKGLANLALELAKDFSKNDIVNVYIPRMFELESTNLRSGDIDFQIKIDSLIQEFYKITKLNYLTIKSDKLEKRVEEILKEVERRGL